MMKKKKWFFISRNEGAKHILDYIVILSEEEFKRTKESSYSSIKTNFNDYVNELSGILALNLYLKLMQKRIMAIRNNVNPMLLKKHIFFNNLNKGFKIFNSISYFGFSLERITKEIDNIKFLFHHFADLENIKTKIRDKDYLLSDELINRYNYLLKENSDYLGLIKSNFQDFISFKTLRYNYKMQFRIFWLTVCIILLSVILLIPEDIRTNLIHRIIKYINYIFTSSTA